jgi:hypothetical protein
VSRKRPAVIKRPPPRAGAPSRKSSLHVERVESLRKDIAKLSRRSTPSRWNAHPDDVQRSVVKLVLTLVEFLRQLLERQALRRMDARTISPEETEAIGLALMRLEQTVRDLAEQFDLTPEDLNLDLGPVGRLL